MIVDAINLIFESDFLEWYEPLYTKCMVPRETVRFVFTRVLDRRATTAQLYLSRDTFEFGRGHVTKNQLTTVLISLSEILGL